MFLSGLHSLMSSGRRVMLVRHVIPLLAHRARQDNPRARVATDHDRGLRRHCGQHGIFDPEACDELDRRIDRIANDPHARAIVIRTVPRGEERQALTEKLDAECILLMPDKAECTTCSTTTVRYTQSNRHVVLGSTHQRSATWPKTSTGQNINANASAGSQSLHEVTNCVPKWSAHGHTHHRSTRALAPAHDPTGTVIIGVSHERCNTSEGA